MNFWLTIRDSSGKIPARAHLHRAGMGAYGNSDGERRRNAVQYLGELVHTQGFNRIVAENRLEYAIAAMWGDDGKRIADLFGFKDVKDKWPGNPDVMSWDFRDGVFTRGALTCGDTLIMLGGEERYRRTTPDLETYMRILERVSDFVPPKF